MLITSLQNPKIKYAVRLKNRSFRDSERMTLIEGYRCISRALEGGVRIEELFYCPEIFLGENEFPLIERIADTGARTYQITEHGFAKFAYRDRPEGLIAIARMGQHLIENIPVKDDGLYVVAERIEKPGNLGSILRSADAAGVAGVLVCDKCTDIYNPNVITASTGTVFSMPIAESSSEDALKWLRDNGVRTLAATPHADRTYTEFDFSGKSAVVVGAEQFGLSKFWMDNSDFQVRIPMLGKADSLNVATATTILLFEAARQKNNRYAS